MKKLTLAIATIFTLCLTGLAQEASIPDGKEMNTTDPPNLSWVVGEFEIIKVSMGEAVLAPIKQSTLPRTVTVKYNQELITQYPWFQATQKLILVIREGQVSQVFTK